MCLSTAFGASRMIHFIVARTALVGWASRATSELWKTEGNRTNPHKSIKGFWGEVGAGILCRILLYLGLVERNVASSFSFAHPITRYFFILVHISSGICLVTYYLGSFVSDVSNCNFCSLLFSVISQWSGTTELSVIRKCKVQYY